MKQAEPSVLTKNILETLKGTNDFTLFVRAIGVAELGAVVSGPGPVTVFAPLDASLSQEQKDMFQRLFHDPGRLTDVLTYHMVPGRLDVGMVMGLTGARTLQGGLLTINACDGLLINTARVIKADIECSNGVIHGIDTVLMPPER
jgi:uncharacterized surface protein with fasciclin (FAS1) repeats